MWKYFLHGLPSAIGAWITAGAVGAMLLGIFERFGADNFARLSQIPVIVIVLLFGVLFGVKRGRVKESIERRKQYRQ